MKHQATRLSTLLALVLFSAGYAAADTGTLVFLFDGRETRKPVDSRASSLQFELYSAGPPTQSSLLAVEERLFAPTVFLNNVSTDATFLRVISFDDYGVPIERYEVALHIVAGEEFEIDLRDGRKRPSPDSRKYVSNEDVWAGKREPCSDGFPVFQP